MAKADLNITTNNDVSQAVKSFDQVKNAAKKANAEIKKDGINISDELASKNREQAKELIGRFTLLGAALKVVGFFAENIKNAFARMAENGRKLNEVASSLGISAQTVATLKAQADAAGVSEAEYAKALEELRNGTSSIDEVAAAWTRVAKETLGAHEANERFAENLRQNLEDLATSRVLDNFAKGWRSKWRNVAAGFIGLFGGADETNAEGVIEYAVSRGIRSDRGKDAAIRRAIGAQVYSPVEGTTMWNARYKELSALFDSRASAVDTERRNSRDDRIASLYDKLGENVGLVMNALSRLGLGSLTETEITEAVNRSRARESTREKDDRSIRAILKEDAELRKANDAAEREAAAMDKMLLSYAYARGGGLLSGINYGFALPSQEERTEREKLVQLGKQTVALSKVVEELKKVYTVLATD